MGVHPLQSTYLLTLHAGHMEERYQGRWNMTRKRVGKACKEGQLVRNVLLPPGSWAPNINMSKGKRTGWTIMEKEQVESKSTRPRPKDATAT